MAIITAIYSFSLRLSLTPPRPPPPPPYPSLSACSLLPLPLPPALFHSFAVPRPPFPRSDAPSELMHWSGPRPPVWLSTGRWTPLLAASYPAVDRCLQSPETYRRLWMQHRVVRHGCTQTELRGSFSLSVCLPLDLDRTPLAPARRTHTRANFSDGCRFPREARYRWGRRLGDSIAAGRVRMHRDRWPMCKCHGGVRTCACAALRAICVCVRDWMRGNCQWNCPQLRRRNTRVVFIGWRLIVVSDGEQGSTVPQVFKVEGRAQWEREWKFGIFFNSQTNFLSSISLKNWLQSVAWLVMFGYVLAADRTISASLFHVIYFPSFLSDFV